MIVALLIILIINAVYGEQSSTLLSSDIDVSEGCRTAVQRLSTLQATKPQLMARYWDSWGKPSDGILTGHTTFLGYYDECIDLKNTDLGDMKYCIYPMVMDTNILQKQNESEDGVCHSSNCPMQAEDASSALNVKVGVCYPSVCSANEFAVVMNITGVGTSMSNLFSDTTNTITVKLNSNKDLSPFCPVTDVEYDTGTIAVIAVCVILVGLVVTGTTVDIVSWASSITSERVKESEDSVSGENIPKKENLSKPTKKISNHPNTRDFILAFSLYTTISNLLMRPSPSALKALGGMKIFSNFIIVILHVYQLTGLLYPDTIQNLYMQLLPTKLIFQPIMGVNFAVETFFLVSATLSAYLTLKDMEKFKKFRFMYFYLNRFFRLSPLLYSFTFIAYKLFVQIGQGPVWFSHDANACAKSWWYNLLYATNTVPVFDMCMAYAWHISADMQLFIVSPVFIILLYHVQYVGLAAVALTMIAATATIGHVSATNGYWAAIYYNPQLTDQLAGLHVQPFYRVNSYFTGILLGYILYKRYNISTLPIRNSSKWLIYALLWVVGIMLCLVTMFGTYGEYSFAYHFSDMENVMFLMFSGLAWSIGIAIIIYNCNTGYGGVVNNFLSWPGWEPLTKLSYGVALCNCLVLYYIMGTLQSNLKYTDTIFAMLAVFTLVASYGVAAMTAVLVEQPMHNVVSLCYKLAGIESRSKQMK